MRRKRDSKRRWKARARFGRLIPRIVIWEHLLGDLGPWEWVHNIDAARLRP